MINLKIIYVLASAYLFQVSETECEAVTFIAKLIKGAFLIVENFKIHSKCLSEVFEFGTWAGMFSSCFRVNLNFY